MQVVETMCDVCRNSIEVTHFTLAVGETMYDIDLCQTCYGERVEPVVTMLKDHGRETNLEFIAESVDPVTHRRPWGNLEPERCVFCGFEGRFETMRKHAMDEHKAGLRVALGAPVKATCPDCGFRLAATKGMAQHQFSAHGKAFARKRG